MFSPGITQDESKKKQTRSVTIRHSEQVYCPCYWFFNWNNTLCTFSISCYTFSSNQVRNTNIRGRKKNLVSIFVYFTFILWNVFLIVTFARLPSLNFNAFTFQQHAYIWNMSKCHFHLRLWHNVPPYCAHNYFTFYHLKSAKLKNFFHILTQWNN